jgi:DNA polymerase-4
MLTVTALHITEEADSYQQLDLLGAQQTQRSEKQEKLELAMDAIRGKYGKGSISFGSNGGKQIGWDD